MRGLDVPETVEDFTADPVELFFDLAFVFAFAQLVGFLVHHPDWTHLGQAALVFTLLWMAWSQVTWAANAVAGNSRTARLVFLIATATSVPMAAAVSTAYGSGGLLFAVPLVVIASTGLVLALQGRSAADEMTSGAGANEFVLAGALFGVLMVAGAIAENPLRTWIWLGAVVVYIVGTLRTTESDWVLRAGHFAERHGLIIIVALGEVIVAVARPLVSSLEEGEKVPGDAVIALAASGVFAAILWWAYFDRVQPALEHRVHETRGPARSSLARDNYTYLHLPIVAGIVLAAAGLEELTLHPDDALDLAFRAMLFGGLAMFLGGIGLAAYRTFRRVARERIASIALIASLLFLAGPVEGVWLIVGIDIILVATLAAEHLRIER